MVDPHYKLLPGRIYDRVKDDYPIHEPLPTSGMPDEIAGYVIQHRFRKSKNGWPLVQLGPGIITLNDTEKYDWDDFKNRIHKLIGAFYETYPQKDNLKISGLFLRYIDAIDLDFSHDNVFTFLQEKLKTQVILNKELFEGTGVNDTPINIDLSFSYQSTKPVGTIHQRFRRGKKAEKESLIWETIITTDKDNKPENKNEIIKWISAAHELTDDWFFKTIKGELEERFSK